MNIALMAHDSKKELMTQFCIAYCGILSRHSLCATGTTGKLVAEATGLEIQRFLSGSQGGDQQIASRIACNEIDLLLMFRDPLTPKPHEPNEANLLRLCDVHNIPVATNIATAEALIHSLARGDLDWRDIVNPKFPAGRLFPELFRSSRQRRDLMFLWKERKHGSFYESCQGHSGCAARGEL